MGMLKCNYYPWIQSENNSSVVPHRVTAAQLFQRQETIDTEGKVFKPMMRIKDVLLLIISMSVKIISMGINMLSPILTILLCIPVSLHGTNNNFPQYFFYVIEFYEIVFCDCKGLGKIRTPKQQQTTRKTTTFNKYQKYIY